MLGCFTNAEWQAAEFCGTLLVYNCVSHGGGGGGGGGRPELTPSLSALQGQIVGRGRVEAGCEN